MNAQHEAPSSAAWHSSSNCDTTEGMSNRRQSDGGDEHDDSCRPLAGSGERGGEFNPSDVHGDPHGDPSLPRPAPAPRTPVGDEEYRRLKEAARHKRQRPGGPAQEDLAGEKAN